LRSLPGTDRARADADTHHLTAEIAQLHRVTHLYRTLEEENQARHEVVDDLLHAEPEPESEGAHQHGDAGEIEAERPEGEQETGEQEPVPHQGGHRVRD